MVPPTVRFPVSVTALDAVILKFPVMADAPSATAAPVIVKLLPNVFPLSRVTLEPEAPIVVVPVTLKIPLSVTAPPAVTFKFPETVEAPKMMPLLSARKTALALPIATVEKLFNDPVKVAELADPRFRVVAPPTVMVVPADWLTGPPLSVMVEPALANERSDEMVMAPPPDTFNVKSPVFAALFVIPALIIMFAPEAAVIVKLLFEE